MWGRGRRTTGPATAATTGGGTPDWNVAMAGCLIVMLPPLVVVALMQRYFVRGLIGADK
jgi:sn-glycerol 3-phosphate transport system permease protein